MLRRLLPIFLMIVLLAPASALSQATTRLSSLEVDLWPEYDRASVLVIYHVTLSSEITLPTEMTFRIPVAAGEPNAVAVRQPDGQLFSVDYQSQIQGEWEVVSFTSTLREIQLEYYDPALREDGDQKNFTYVWPGDYDVDQMVLQVQLPVGGSGMQVTPGPISGKIGADGLTYYTKEIGSVTTGQSFSIDLTYQKNSTQLSVESLQVQPSAPLSPAKTWRDKLRSALPWLFTESGSTYQILPWILGFLALLLIFGGGYWYWRTGRQDETPRRRRRTRSPVSTADELTEETGNVYCHQCGKRASPGDSFCRACGTRLRIE